MAKKAQPILDRARAEGLAGPTAGMSVPDGYFESFAERMSASLPARPELESAEVSEARRDPASFWSRVRPYVYMAAMFAGVWCMLQLFSMLAGHGSLQPIESNPVLAKALASDEFVMDYVYDDYESWDLLDDMMEEGSLDSDGRLFFDDASADSDLETPTYILPQ